MNTTNNNPVWVIKCEKTGKYFSLLGSPHFTDNVEIAQRFDSENDAVLCEEQHIFNNLDLLDYDSMPTVLLPQSVTNEAEAKQVISYLMSVLGGGFHPDTPIADYVNIHTDKQTFTEAEISLLQPLLDQCFGVMGDDVYNYAMEVYCSNEATNLNIN